MVRMNAMKCIRALFDGNKYDTGEGKIVRSRKRKSAMLTVLLM